MIGKKQTASLKRLAAKRSTADLKALFALVRAHNDSALLAAIGAKKRTKAKRAEPLLRDVEAILKPLMARSAEKAQLLVDHLGVEVAPRGLAEALRQLRAAKMSDAQIRKGAKSLMADLGQTFSGRETVV